MSRVAEIQRRKLREARVPNAVWTDPASTTTHKVQAFLPLIDRLLTIDNMTEKKTVMIAGSVPRNILNGCAACAKAMVTKTYETGHKVRFVQLREMVEALRMYYTYSHRDEDSQYYDLYRTSGGDSTLVIPDLATCAKMPDSEEGMRQDMNMRLRNHLMYGGNLIMGSSHPDLRDAHNLEDSTKSMIADSLMQVIKV